MSREIVKKVLSAGVDIVVTVTVATVEIIRELWKKSSKRK